MGFLDDMKDAAEKAVDVADDLADEHGDQARQAIDKAADLVDDKTGGTYDDQIDTGVDKAKGVIADLEHNDR